MSEQETTGAWSGLVEDHATRQRAVTMGADLVPGVNLDRIDVASGMDMLDSLGDFSPETRTVIAYALRRWAKGEETAAQRGAIDPGFHGIDLTAWLMVLAAAMAGAVEKVGQA
jgi:hypothetical protein